MVTHITCNQVSELWHCVADCPDSSASSHGKVAVGASAFDILPTRGVLKAGQTQAVEFAYYARPGEKAAATAVCEVEGGPTYTLPVSADSNAIKYRLLTICILRKMSTVFFLALVESCINICYPHAHLYSACSFRKLYDI